jgi:hypothetical protein
MAWTAPMTAVDTATFSANEFNTHVRDNLLQQGPAKVTATGQYLMTAGFRELVAWNIEKDFQSGTVSTTNNSYEALSGGPTVTVTTGSAAMVFFGCNIYNSSSNWQANASVAVSGATYVPASDKWRISWDGFNSGSGNACRFSSFHRFEHLNPGSHTFTMQYRNASANAGNFLNRTLIVMPM